MCYITKIRFHISCGYKNWIPSFDINQNTEIFGDDTSQEGLGNNLVVDIGFENLNVPIDEIELQLKPIVMELDHQFLNEKFSFFKDYPSSVENIAYFLFRKIQSDLNLKNFILKSVRIKESDDFWVEDFGPNHTNIVTASLHLNCLHRHFNPNFSEQKNTQIYGQCSGLHGHEYIVEVSVGGNLDIKKSYLISRRVLRQKLKDDIYTQFHGKYLNDIIGNTSGETLINAISQKLKESLPGFYQVALHETKKNSFFMSSKNQEVSLVI